MQIEPTFKSALFNIALMLTNNQKRPAEAVSYVRKLLEVCTISMIIIITFLLCLSVGQSELQLITFMIIIVLFCVELFVKCTCSTLVDSWYISYAVHCVLQTVGYVSYAVHCVSTVLDHWILFHLSSMFSLFGFLYSTYQNSNTVFAV